MVREQVVGENTIGKVIKTLMKDAGIEGYFTNHSARCTGGTCLFRGGVNRKLVKDAVDKYQINSDEQREAMSKIIAGNQGKVNKKNVSAASGDHNSVSATIKVSQDDSKCKVESGKIGGIIDEIIQRETSGLKTVIKINIEIIKE